MTIYLDNNATTPLDERALEAMLPYLRENFGNPSSAHAHGWTAEAAVELAREELAEGIGASPEEVVFTSGATEADNTALYGMLHPGDHLVTTATEHEAILESVKDLERLGIRVTVLPVDSFGLVSPKDLREAVTPETTLVSIMLANNETGAINPVRELAEVAHEAGVPFHTDAAQALGKVPVSAGQLGVDLMSLSAHKCYGPKGVGALYVRRRPLSGVRRVRPEPLLRGGGQERGLRSGTLNVPGIVGFGRAASLAAAALPEECDRIAGLRDKLWKRLVAGVPDAHLNGHPEARLPNTLNVSFQGIGAGELLAALPEVAASAGSACASASPEPSPVLRAMGVSERVALSSVRFSLGRFTTSGEVETAAEHIVRAAREVQAAVPDQGER
ncbi:MAG: cysteine desulfurase family protein [Rubrobacteraceae bacterium]